MQVDERELYRYIGQRIRTARTSTGLTQRQLADRLGVERTSITNVEAGRQRIPVHMLYRFCVALEIEVIELLPSVQLLISDETDACALSAQLENIPPKTAEVIRSLLRDWPEGSQ